MLSFFKFFAKKKTQVEKPKGLLIGSSVYPSFPNGMSETEKFNSTWRSIAKASEEVYETLKRPSNK